MRKEKMVSALLIFFLVLSISESFGLSYTADNDEYFFSDNAIFSPDAPRDPIPTDGQEGLNVTPELSVYVTHPDGSSMSVSFYDYNQGTLIGTVYDVPSEDRATIQWEGLSPNSDYSWYAEADDGENTSTGGPWNFSTAGVDYVRITDEIDGNVLTGGDVPPDHEEWGYLSGYNNTFGFVGNFQGRWEASGNASLLKGEYEHYNGINVGETAGDVWFNVTYVDVYHHGVQFTVLTDQADYIQITESPGGEPLSDESVPVGTQARGYCSVYNKSLGYLYTVEGNWSAEGGDSQLLESSTNESNVIDVGLEEGTVWFNLTYENLSDSVKFEVLTPTVDRISITDIPDGVPLEDKEVPVGHKIWGNASAYNETSGYLGTVLAEWLVEFEGGMNPSLGPTPAETSWLDVGLAGGNLTWKASYFSEENWYNHTVNITVKAPTLDFVQITSDGNETIGGPVPVNHTVNLELSAYNDTAGLLHLVNGDWEVDGGDAYLLNGTIGVENVLNVGTIPGEVLLDASYEGFTDSVLFIVEDPAMDYILIRSEPDGDGEVLEDLTLERYDSVILHAAGYNTSSGFLGDLEVNWILDNEEVGDIQDDFSSSTIFTGLKGGVCNVTAQLGDVQHITEITVIDTHLPDIVGSIPDVELEKNFGLHEIDLEGYASDEYDSLSEMRWYLTNVSTAIVNTFGENQTGNHVITLLSQENANGSMRVTYWLVNSVGNKASQEAWINVTDGYEPPTFKRCPDLYVHYDEPYIFDYSPYIIYDEEKKHELELETDDPEHTIVDGLNVIYEYPESMLGQEILIVITVSDGIESDYTAITVTVTSNHPPKIIKRLPDVEIEQGELKENVFNLDDYFVDPEGQPLYMSYGYTYLAITIHADNTVDIRADVNWHGLEKVTFRATDPGDALVEQTINVTVIPVNYPPEIKDLPQFVVHYDEPYTFDLNYYISDRDNETHELTITTCSPEYVTVQGTKLHMLYPEKMGDLYRNYTVPLEVFVSDGIDSASKVTTVTVGDIYPPELIIPLHDVAFKENEKLINAFRLDNHFIDRQNDTMYYSSGNENIEVVIHENSTVDFYAPRYWNGQELITIRATNSAGALMEDSLTVTVIPVNNPPFIYDIPRQEGWVRQSWIFDMGDYIWDVDNETHELEVLVDDPNVQVVRHKLIFYYDTPGTYYVTVEVSDGIDSNITEIEVLVKDEERGIFADAWILLLIGLVSMTALAAVFHFKKDKFTAEDIFLIHDSGVLIKHNTRTLKAERDEDILAGMFLAVSNFVEDAFGGEEKDTLKRMEYGDNKVLVHKGKHVILATFLSGTVPSWLLESMSNLVVDIEERYEGNIEEWRGKSEDLPGIGKMLDAMIKGKGKYVRGDWRKKEY